VKPVVARFDTPHASADGGAILLKSVDTHLGLTKRLAGCLVDGREPGKVHGSTPGNGIGLIAVGMHRRGLRLSLSHVADGEWRRGVGLAEQLEGARPRLTGCSRATAYRAVADALCAGLIAGSR
jgi:hypothetical protein